MIDRRRALILTAAPASLCLLPSPVMRAHAQPATRKRRIALLMSYREGDPESVQRAEVFKRSLGEAGWKEGQNVEIEVHHIGGGPERALAIAKAVASAGFDAIVVNGTPGLRALKPLAPTVPIVFVVITDPVGEGFVASLARPGGNITGFSTFEPEIAGKWLEILREVVPQLERVGVPFDPAYIAFVGLARMVAGVGKPLGVETVDLPVKSAADIEAAIAAFAQKPNGALILTPSPINSINRDRIIAQTTELRLPAIWPYAFHARGGGLMAYGPDPIDMFKRAGPYVARILSGEKPADLPVQAPIKFELVLNMKTAKAMGLTFPQWLLATADEVIE